MQSESVMIHKGYKAQIMEAQRLVGDQVFGLPPGTPLPVYHSDAFVEWPLGWIKGQGTFLVPVQPNKGLWFNWTMNDANNTAVLPTVKGCNPITGMQTSGFHLERYDTKCPKHGCDFQGDRYCPECDYKWPFGNYVASPNTLWIDGMVNQKDGSVRQFFFTEEELRDVATHMIGKENTVPAFGFAFYKPKEPRPSMPNVYRGSGMFATATKFSYYNSSGNNSGSFVAPGVFISTFSSGLSDNLKGTKSVRARKYRGSGATTGSLSTGSNIGDSFEDSTHVYCCSASENVPMACAAAPVEADLSHLMDVDYERGISVKSLVDHPEPKTVKEVSVGAGAKINQALAKDPFSLDSWCDAPEAVMTIYFVFQEKFEELKAGGMRDLEGKPEGMLSGIPVG